MDEYKKFVCPKKCFQKKNSKCEILNHFYFGPNFVFLETALGRFSQCFFKDFSSSANHGGRHFYSVPPHHKKASYGPVSAQKCYNFITLSVWIVYKHMCLKIQLCLKIWFSTSFDITRYAGAAISAKNLLFFSFYNFFVKLSE